MLVYNFECCIYTNLYFDLFMLCVNTTTSVINTNVFFDLTDVQVPDIWWPSTGSEEGGPMEYFNSTGIVKEWNHFYIRLSGFIHIPDAGQYTFYLAADDGATLYIDGVRVLDNTGVHGMAVEQSPLWLSGGYHQLQVNMQQNVGDRGLQLEGRWHLH